MKKHSLYYFLLFALLYFSQCKKSKPDFADNSYGLPNATQTGAGVFACRINGLNRIAKNQGLPYQGGWNTPDSVIVAASFGSVNYFEILRVVVLGKVLTGTPYSLSDAKTTKIDYSTDSTCHGVSSSLSSADKASGTITFSKIDSIKKIISGNFSFTIPIEGCDSLHFTDGRFDIGY